MKRSYKRILTVIMAIALILSMSITAFAQTKTITYKASGGVVIGQSVVTFKNKGLSQTNTITISNGSKYQIYVMIDGCGRYIAANKSYKLSYKAYLGVTTSTKIKIQSMGNDVNWRNVTISTSSNGSISFTKGSNSVAIK